VTNRLPLLWRLRALATVAVVPPLLYVVSFSRLARWLSRPLAQSQASDLDDASLARWVDRLLRHLPNPWRRTCLKRSAILYQLLRRAGRPVELWIGVHKTGTSPLAAHAWLVRGGEPYLESHPEHPQTHTVIARFPETPTAAAQA
jgi:transglutaminase superfamily protein